MLEKPLESPLDSKEIQPVHPKGNQSWIVIGRIDAEAEATIFGHLMHRTDSLEKTMTLGQIEGRRRRGRQKMTWLDGITDSMGMSLSKLWEMVMDRQVWYAEFHRVTKSWTWLSDGAELNWSRNSVPFKWELPSPLPPAPGTCYFTFGLYVFDYGIIYYLFSCDCLFHLI